ncbi:hypothetical protein JCM11641_002792 [Rhodosporidiobolus odoratus]
MSENALETLQSMGFPETRSKLALKEGKGGLSQALDFLELHSEKSDDWWVKQAEMDAQDGDGEEGDAAAAAAAAAEGGEEGGAKSLKCMECGKTFRNTALAQYHGTKSGHSQFEESTEELKPLTQEEKDEKLRELRAKMDEKRRIQAKSDAADARRNEEIRRKSGKDEAQRREELKVNEVKKEAERRKREKAEDVAAKAKIKAQIEEDKKARAAKSAREKALREGRNPDEDSNTSLSVPSATAPQPSSTTGGEKKTYDSARLQIRLPSGPPLVHSLPAGSKVREIVEFVKEKTGLGEVKLTMSFPRKTFTEADLDQDLKQAGLVPSAALIVS